MRNMKTLLKLLGAVNLTIVAASSVAACHYNPDVNVTMNIELSKQLKLTDNLGEGLQAASLDTSVKDNVMWTVDALKKPINASDLLGQDDTAANQTCFDFIINTLKVNPKKGTTLSTAVFDKNMLLAFIGKVKNIKPVLTKSKDDYVITGGTFDFEFINYKNEKVSDKYSVNLKTSLTVGVIANALKKVVNNFIVADTDVLTNPNILFVRGGKIPEGAKKGAIINIVGTTDAVKQFNSLKILTGLNITAELNSRSEGFIWDAGHDWLAISYKTLSIKFDYQNVKNEFRL